MKKMCILVVLDGWGVGKQDESNPIYMAKKPAFHFIEEHFPMGALQASGISIGLPWDTASGSELGHFSIGAGKIIYQNYPRISLAIRDGSFFENTTLKNCFAETKKNGGAVHFFGTLSRNTEKSALEHIVALLQMAKNEKIDSIFLHITISEKDGTALEIQKLIAQFEETIKKQNARIASITGEYFIKNIEQNQKTSAPLLALLENGKATHAETIIEAFQKASTKNANPSLMEPTMLADGKSIQENDAIIFWNFEPSGWQFIAQNFEKKGIKNLSLVTLTQYPGVSALPAFPEEKYEITLGKTLADAKMTQMHIAETLRGRSVTYFLNGLREEPYEGEYRTIVPSPRMLNIAEHPELSAKAITERVLMTLTEGAFDFVVVNYANPDVIASTGDYEATKRAIEILDGEIEKITNAALSNGHTLIILGSHGNAEMLLNLETGEVDTQHKPNPVPFYLVRKDLMNKTAKKYVKILPIGILADVAPTILELLAIQKPNEMTGESLLRELL